jgi:hypothetical protein
VRLDVALGLGMKGHRSNLIVGICRYISVFFGVLRYFSVVIGRYLCGEVSDGEGVGDEVRLDVALGLGMKGRRSYLMVGISRHFFGSYRALPLRRSA